MARGREKLGDTAGACRLADLAQCAENGGAIAFFLVHIDIIAKGPTPVQP